MQPQAGDCELHPIFSSSGDVPVVAADTERAEHRHPGYARTKEVVAHRETLDLLELDADASQASKERRLHAVVDERLPKETRPAKHNDHRPGANPPQPSRIATRNFSISAQGSPLPVHHREAHRAPDVFERPRSSKPAEKGPSIELPRSELPRPATLDASSRGPNRAQHEGNGGIDTRRQAQHRDPIADLVEGIPGRIHAQILASLQNHGTDPGERFRHLERTNLSMKDCRVQGETQAVSSPSDSLTQRLHQLIEVSSIGAELHRWH